MERRHLQMQIGSLTVRATLQPSCQVDVASESPLQPQRFRLSKLEKRQARKVSQEARTTEFLVKNHFFLDDINEPRGPGRYNSEQLWPIHAAAELGDGELLRSLLRARADSTKVPWIIIRCIQQVSDLSIVTIRLDRFNSQEAHKIKVMQAVNESRPKKQLSFSGANAAPDCLQVTSFGRTATDIAREANRQGSHQEVIQLLVSGVRCCSWKDFKKLAGSSE